ncbi:MAG: hypothetical protein REH83_01015 [Rickettsiella sp.]|nr:hypothetical protein [Rickettsiella sp.]
MKKNIEFTVRFACLCGVIQFYTVNKKYLTCQFIEKLFSLFNFPEARNFFLEYKQEFKDKMNSLAIYIPHYQHLVRKEKVVWEETVTISDIERWRANLRTEIAKAMKADNTFIKEYNLTPFSLFKENFYQFINILLLDIDDIEAKEVKKEIFLLTREIKEQIAIFTDKKHSLREFFSIALLDVLRKKNNLNTEKLLEKCEDEENTRIKVEAEKNKAEQLEKRKFITNN